MPRKTSTSSAGQKPDPNEYNPYYEVRKSGVHGYGGFAKRDLKKGTRITEYLGDRISHKEADRRYEDHDENDNHTFLFIVDKRTVIDAGVGGNNARFINHQCDPNCESTIEKGRVWIETIRDVKKGEELGYDYQIGREKDDPENVDEIYACRCGSPKCRGTMLWPPTREQFLKSLARKRKKKKKKSAQKGGRRKRSAKKK
ncbi:MAG TPA: SET domain-containing protein-lysine N-methyltransferase [Steroidobacteraceae bacterium]|jgi:SET domain-containing protein|nr:SET domain-containing protein-lysine N-methyltransferase [Steroidobacteraceae bacterium]